MFFFDYVFISIFGFDVWGLAAGFTVGVLFQATTLFYVINRRINGESFFRVINPLIKSVFASITSGSVMYFLLKVFDRSVWVKRLSFLGKIEATKYLPFENFVFDTRYTVNLIVLTIFVAFVGAVVYITTSIALRSKQVWIFFNLLKRIFVRRKVAPIPAKEPEPVTPSATDTTG